MNFLFQNEHFILVEKPALMLTVPGRFEDKDERPVLGRLLQSQLGKNVYPVHRLDYEVSGLVLFALTAKAHQAGNSWFEKKKVRKVYEALAAAEAVPNQEPLPEVGQKLEWTSQLLRGKKRAYESPVGKPALTMAVLREARAGGVFFWQLEPVTGRSHQLRYELFKRGFPILGDALYGSRRTWSQGIALRAMKISFPVEAREFGLPMEYDLGTVF
jgi:tRNA pseudouridine32 synthase/23S rRNA pseudouridine746 synthase